MLLSSGEAGKIAQNQSQHDQESQKFRGFFHGEIIARKALRE